MSTSAVAHSLSRNVRSPRHLTVLCLVLLCQATVPIASLTAAESDSRKSDALQRIFSGGIPTSPDELRLMEVHQRQLVDRVTPTIVGIQIGESQGSGVIISPDGYVLTAAHVAVEPNLAARITLSDGRSFTGKTLGMNRGTDAGLIKIINQPGVTNPTTWTYADMGDTTALQPGTWCVAFGHPGGYQAGRLPVVRVGRVLSINNLSLQTDCALVGGDSGGPLFDMQGKVIGIHSRIGADITKNLHVPVNTYRATWDRLAQGESWGNILQVVGRPVIGVHGVQQVERAEIETVVPGFPAERAGIRAGDIIVRFAGQPVEDFPSLKRLVDESNPGEQVPVEVLRDSKRLQLMIVIGTPAG